MNSKRMHLRSKKRADLNKLHVLPPRRPKIEMKISRQVQPTKSSAHARLPLTTGFTSVGHRVLPPQNQVSICEDKVRIFYAIKSPDSWSLRQGQRPNQGRTLMLHTYNP